MKLSKLLAVAALAFSSAAFAGNYNLGTLNSTPWLISGFSGTTGYDFALSGQSSFNSSFSGWGLSSVKVVNKTTGAQQTASFSNSTLGSFLFNLAQGSYSFYVTTLSGGFFLGSVGATASVAAPVPEADTYAMLLVGMAGIGLVGLRRRRD